MKNVNNIPIMIKLGIPLVAFSIPYLAKDLYNVKLEAARKEAEIARRINDSIYASYNENHCHLDSYDLEVEEDISNVNVTPASIANSARIVFVGDKVEK